MSAVDKKNLRVCVGSGYFRLEVQESPLGGSIRIETRIMRRIKPVWEDHSQPEETADD